MWRKASQFGLKERDAILMAASRVAGQTVRGYSVLDQQLSALQAVENSDRVSGKPQREGHSVFSRLMLIILFAVLLKILWLTSWEKKWKSTILDP